MPCPDKKRPRTSQPVNTTADPSLAVHSARTVHSHLSSAALREGGAPTLLELFRRNPVRSHVGLQRLGDAARCRRPAGSSPRSPPRCGRSPGRCRSGCARIGSLLALRAVADVGPPRLESLEVRARGDLAEDLLARQPDFQVVGLGGWRSPCRRAQQHAAIGQPQPLQHGLGVARQLLVLLVGLLRGA